MQPDCAVSRTGTKSSRYQLVISRPQAREGKSRLSRRDGYGLPRVPAIAAEDYYKKDRKLNINPIYLGAIQTGLHEAAQGGGPLASPGTSQTMMQNFGKPVYGQVGTAQYGVGVAGETETDYAWDASYVSATATHTPIVVITWVQGGGFGSVAAAPVARELLSQWFTGKPGRFVPGDSDAQ